MFLKFFHRISWFLFFVLMFLRSCIYKIYEKQIKITFYFISILESVADSATSSGLLSMGLP